jgi:hypothetical protein
MVGDATAVCDTAFLTLYSLHLPFPSVFYPTICRQQHRQTVVPGLLIVSAGQVRSLPNGYTDAQTVGVVTRQHGAAQLGKTFAVNARATLGGKVGGATFEGVGEQTTTRVNII